MATRFLDLDGLKAFKSGCDGRYDAKSFLTTYGSRMSDLNVNFNDTPISHRNFIGIFNSDSAHSPGFSGHLISLAWDNNTWGSQMALRDGDVPTMAVRTVKSPNGDDTTWTSWATVLTDINYPTILANFRIDDASIDAIFN